MRGLKTPSRAVAAAMLTAIYHMLKDATETSRSGARHFDHRRLVTANRPVAQLSKLPLKVEIQPIAEAA